MTDEEIRIAIAEDQGWQFIDSTVISPIGVRFHRCEAMELACGIPDYLNDLNACAEFEKTLKGNAHSSAVTDDERKYRDELAKVMGCAWYQSARLIFATARQRCEAFLRVKELWK